MIDRGIGLIEMGGEYIPSSVEVKALFADLVEGKKYVETKKLEDEKGLYRWDIEICTEDGGKKEYLYIRKGNYPSSGDNAVETAIHVVNYDKDGIPCSGGSVMKCDEHGTWRRTP